MAHPMGESKEGVLRLDFDRRLKLEFHGSKVTSDAGLLPYRELDDAVGLTEIAGDVLTDTRRGRNGRHGLSQNPYFSLLRLKAASPPSMIRLIASRTVSTSIAPSPAIVPLD